MTTTYVQPPTDPRAVEQAHHCPVPSCPTLCSPGHVACRYHWRRVPQPLRDPLINAFRLRRYDPVGFHVAQDEARRLVVKYARR